MKNFSPYTDLALEVAESLTNNTDNDLEGLKIFTEDCEMKKTSVTSQSSDRKSTRLNSSHPVRSRMPSSA